MSLFRTPKTPASTPPSKLANINVTTAVIGRALTILMGQRRVSQSLIYYSDFTAIPHVQKTASGGGGKGLGGGGGSSQTSTTYTYTAATMGALCSGPVNGIVNVWDSKGKFQQTNATESYTIPGGGGTHQVVNHGLYKVDQGVGFAQAYSQAVDDFGSPGPATLSGTFQVPMTVGSGAGQYSVNTATGTYTFHPADAGKTVSITYSFNLLNINNSEDVTIPGTPFQVLVEDSADFLQDSGVVFTDTNTALIKVASSPAAGQYSVNSAGLYTFNTADATKQVQISYVTNTQNQQSDAQTSLNVTLLPGTKSQAPWSYLTSRHPEAAIGYTETAIVASQAMDLGSNGELPNYSFEVAGPYQYGSGIVDCDPADCVAALMSDPSFGIQFPTSAFGDWTQASNFWVANNFFISPLIESQTSLSSQIGNILEAGMTASFWSEGLLKLVPYGDTSAADNGQIFVPNTQPIVDLTDDDFIGDGLVKVTRTSWQDANNKVQITWSNRLNGYNSEVSTEQDDAAIQRYGLRMENPQSWDFITTLPAAQVAGNLRVKRSVNIRAQYTFSISSNYSYLEPMDLVTITVPELGWNKLPVRLQRIIDHPDENGLEITAEEFPWGTAQPTLYGKQTGVGFTPNAGQADPGNTQALVFEAPDRLAMQQGNLLYIFCSGQSPDWGGCNVYTSFDGVNYQFVQQITNPSRIGTLSAGLAAGTVDPDTSNFTVTMANAGATFPSMSLSDFDQFISLCALVRIPTTLRNGDFEESSALPPPGWSVPFGTASYNTTSPHSGTRALAFTAAGVCEVVSNSVTAVPGDTFILNGFWFNSNVIEAGIQFVDSTGTVITNPNTTASAPTQWTPFTVTGTAPAGTASVRFTIFCGGSPNTGGLDDITLTCSNNTTIELFAYQNATLAGANLYKLDTFHRGLMGTANIAHGIGETFARLDQASLTYQYDPSYYGKTIFFKFPSFNTVGGRPQPLSQASAYSFALPGNSPGAIDLNTGIYRPGKGSLQSISFPSFSVTRNTTSLTLNWSGDLTRGTVPTPSQPSNTIDTQSQSGSITVTGLTSGTDYWFYGLEDDLNGVPTVTFVTNAIASGAVGSSTLGAIAYTSPNITAGAYQQRNDHVPLGVIATSTTSSGTSSGSGGGSGSLGGCPRTDMVVLHRDKGVVEVGTLVPGDFIWGKEKGVDQWVQIQGMNRKMRRDWMEIEFDCGEAIVVTPNHIWQTDQGDTMSSNISAEHVFYQTEGRTFLNGWHKVRGEAECIGMELASEDHAYYIGRKVPKVLTHNAYVIASS